MNTLLDTALYWLDNGVSPIPIKHRSKIPLLKWTKLVDNLPKREIVEKWFQDQERNIAVVCGSSNLCVVDFDQLPLWYKWKNSMGNKDGGFWKDIEKKTYSVRTSRGLHLYFVTNQPEVTRHNKEFSIDVKGYNSIVITPPSVHPSGCIYKPISGRMILNIDRIPIESDTTDPIISEKTVVFDHNIDDSIKCGTPIHTIKKHVYIADLVQRYTKLHKTSQDGRYWMGFCPLHNDKNPSLSIDLITNRCKCKSTSCELSKQNGVDVIDFYSLVNHVTKKEAIKNLLKEFNLEDENDCGFTL